MIQSVNTDRKAVAFTFDDGPNPVYTPQLLAIFREYGAKATFFTIGQQLEKYPEVAKQTVEEGHELGNHTYSHPNLTERSPEERKTEIERTDSLIASIAGQRPSSFRPPYLAANDEVKQLCEGYGYAMISALNLDSEDWRMPGVDHIVETVRKQVRNGAILIFHDGFDDRSQSVEAVRILTKELIAQGYELVSVRELLAQG